MGYSPQRDSFECAEQIDEGSTQDEWHFFTWYALSLSSRRPSSTDSEAGSWNVLESTHCRPNDIPLSRNRVQVAPVDIVATS